MLTWPFGQRLTGSVGYRLEQLSGRLGRLGVSWGGAALVAPPNRPPTDHNQHPTDVGVNITPPYFERA